MAFRPNYGQQRADRRRAKQAKQDEKLRLRQEQAAARKAAGLDDDPALEGETADAEGADADDDDAAEPAAPTSTS